MALPLLVGGGIYLLLRSRCLMMFRWADAIGLGAALDYLRASAEPLRPWLPDCVIFSLPDGAWAYAWCAHFGHLWRAGSQLRRMAWVVGGPALLLCTELAQGAGVVPGTFDAADLVATLVATAMPLLGIALDSRSRAHAVGGMET